MYVPELSLKLMSGVRRLGELRLTQLLAYRVPPQAVSPGQFLERPALSKAHPPNLGQLPKLIGLERKYELARRVFIRPDDDWGG